MHCSRTQCNEARVSPAWAKNYWRLRLRLLQYNIAIIARHGNNGVWTLSLPSPHHLDSTLSFDHDLVIAMPDSYPHHILHRSLLRT
jgi:hypothetical protein